MVGSCEKKFQTSHGEWVNFFEELKCGWHPDHDIFFPFCTQEESDFYLMVSFAIEYFRKKNYLSWFVFCELVATSSVDEWGQNFLQHQLTKVKLLKKERLDLKLRVELELLGNRQKELRLEQLLKQQKERLLLDNLTESEIHSLPSGENQKGRVGIKRGVEKEADEKEVKEKEEDEEVEEDAVTEEEVESDVKGGCDPHVEEEAAKLFANQIMNGVFERYGAFEELCRKRKRKSLNELKSLPVSKRTMSAIEGVVENRLEDVACKDCFTFSFFSRNATEDVLGEERETRGASEGG
jgi:hypothetical protein